MDKIKIHEQLCKEMHELYERKNADYGDSFAQLRKRYPNFVCMRLFDKLNRLDTVIQPEYALKVSDETLEDTLMDIANYAIMELTERRAAREELKESMYTQGSCKPCNEPIKPPNKLPVNLTTGGYR
nr:MAG TPA: Nucleotide modification associated domain 1 [Bacteriophage sp.]